MFQSVNPKKSFPQIEHDQLGFWEEKKIFEKSVVNRKGRKKYVFFDGPPFANGLPHYGHILAGSMKDAVTRYWTMRGYYVPRANGWDCHGLPVEYEIEKELQLSGRKDIEKMGVGKFNDACRESVFRYTTEWEKLMKRIARWVDFDQSYATLDNNYMESIWWVFQQIWKKKMMYRGYKSMHICPRCETPLSNFEVSQGYKEITDTSVTVKFQLTDGIYKGASVLAWTTTPWTLPGNMFLAVNPKVQYVMVELEGEKYILAESLVGKNFVDKEFKILEKIDLKKFLEAHYEPLFPFFKNASGSEKFWRVVPADFVTVEDGTGVVHIAPAFGEDDMSVGVREGVEPILHVKMDGTFVEAVKPWFGKFSKGQDLNIKDALAAEGKIFHFQNYRHSYPHCWRCDTPLLNYSTTSWFIRVTEIKDEMLRNNKKIHWQPGHIQEGRFGKWLDGARDWAISRNRFWGCPIPIWECACGEITCIGSIEELKKMSCGKLPMRGDELDLHKPYIDEVMFPCEKCGKVMRRIPDVLDCWFESGAMPYAQLHYPFENKKEFEDNFPADFIAEGLDQTRGWFYTLHVISTILFNKPAFQNVIVNGIMLAADGEKLSKRKKNYPDPNVLFDQHGVDATRMFLFTSPAVLGDDVRFSDKFVEEIVKQLSLPLWNSYSFFVTYANIDGWEPKMSDSFKPKHRLDQWVLSELHTLIQTVTDSVEKYDLMNATRPFLTFVDNLSNWYIRRSRRRFWKSESDTDKDEAYQTLYTVLVNLSKMLAPFMPFLADEMYKNLVPEGKESVHLEDFPRASRKFIKGLLNEEIRIIRQIVNLGHSVRAKSNIKVRQPLSKLQIALPADISPELIEHHRDVILEELNVKEIEFLDEVSGLVKSIVLPNAKLLGPKYGKDVQEIIRLCKEGKFEIGKDGIIKVGEFTLNSTEVEIGYQGIGSLGVASSDGCTVLLDTELTNPLIEEGIARDLIRALQDMRKEANYQVSDRIFIAIECEDLKIATAVTNFADYIRRETLANELQQGGDFEWDLEKIVEVDGKKVKVGVRK
ncbi:MAG: isoleucine--tRNA ligase [Patescibacteria group bacterium]